VAHRSRQTCLDGRWIEGRAAGPLHRAGPVEELPAAQPAAPAFELPAFALPAFEVSDVELPAGVELVEGVLDGALDGDSLVLDVLPDEESPEPVLEPESVEALEPRLSVR
jgi:hypothetical protein